MNSICLAQRFLLWCLAPAYKPGAYEFSWAPSGNEDALTVWWEPGQLGYWLGQRTYKQKYFGSGASWHRMDTGQSINPTTALMFYDWWRLKRYLKPKDSKTET